MVSGNAIIAQSGGPTAVINNSVCGVIQEWYRANTGGKMYAGIAGIKGILEGDIIDLGYQDPKVIEGLKYTPGAGLWSCRYKVNGDDQEKLIDICKKLNIRYFFYNGGNDSMDTAYKTYQAAVASGWEMQVIGVPKTVDNDLPFTDHCPGYGSAAKYIATTVLETGYDLQSVSTKTKVTILEAMGRNAGWLTAAGALAKRTPDEAPHLIYLPEVAFSKDQFLKDVEAVYNRLGYVYIVASEGLADADGNYFCASENKDAFGHAQLSGLGDALKQVVEGELGLKARCNTLGSAQRSATHWASKTDMDEAYAAGATAVKYALAGKTGVMVSLDRAPGSVYQCTMGEVPLEKVANVEKKIPLEWINKEHNYVTQEFIDYARPLIIGEPTLPMENGVPAYVTIDRNLGKVSL